MRSLPEPLKKRLQQIGTKLNWAEARTQILLCYLGLMLLFIGISVPVVYRALFRDIERRLQADVVDEVQEFLEVLAQSSPQTIPEFKQLADQYLDDELVDPGQYFIFIADGQFYRSSPPELPASIQNNSPLMEKWQSLSQMTQSEQAAAEPGIGTVIYRVEPIFLRNQAGGVFVAVQTTGGEQQQVRQIVRSVLVVMLLMLVIAAVLAWFISGRILQPLRSMAETARSISEANLSKRIAVTGQGELAQVATTFNEMMDRLQTSFLSQQNFINDASHELRTPITIIQGHLDLMSDDPQEQREVLGIVNDELNRMNRFVNDLLTLAKAGRPDFMRSELIELESFTEELYQKARIIAQCQCKLDAVATGNLSIDRQRLTQAVLNLVENANQHTPQTGTIAIGSSKSRKNIRFWVRDTGKGISAADQKRIFERFARGSTAQRRSEGAGLGLSIVRAIAAAAGGRIEVKSKQGEGSTFTLILPISKGHKATSYQGSNPVKSV
ncbi:MAG: HAMP domain-containing protein [Pegethrix bostrychoides GSE-TBD4-15B]|jgi:signal transduction histidine kinase|uniref:histidine kinase n=1 Tax=Pegethrix bostrychoides GSE-TBD4-15B TaxID=2839662 RepID=A0A951U347_9CYAN|nr:HAMP domain-containing protein [Pegethrix bostrychoides GSE-TBD4-15B]